MINEADHRIQGTSPHRDLAKSFTWIDSLHRALDEALPEESSEDGEEAPEPTERISSPHLQSLLYKIKSLQQDLRNHHKRLAKAKEQLEAEELAATEERDSGAGDVESWTGDLSGGKYALNSLSVGASKLASMG